MNKRFWKGKRVLVTGHTGFKGSWLCLWLERLGARLCGYALPPPTNPSLFELARVAGDMESISGDIRDFPRLRTVIQKRKPEIIFHLAAQSVVGVGYEDPLETYSTNVLGTVNLLEAVRQNQSPCAMINVTSDKCYENREWFWAYREEDPLGGRDPYSNSKACAELVTSAFRRSYFPDEEFGKHGIALATARAGNVIGGGDWTKDQLIPDLLRGFMEGRPVLIRSPKAVRPWQFVLDPLHGYLCLAEKLWDRGAEFAGPWNFGPEEAEARPVSWIVESLSARWGEGASWKRDENPHPHEAGYLKLDSSKARTLLGWSTKIRLAHALDLIVEWYQAYRQTGEAGEITQRQISLYENIDGAVPPAEGDRPTLPSREGSREGKPSAHPRLRT